MGGTPGKNSQIANNEEQHDLNTSKHGREKEKKNETKTWTTKAGRVRRQKTGEGTKVDLNSDNEVTTDLKSWSTRWVGFT